MRNKLYTFCLLGVLFFVPFAKAQVPVNINSGNPAFPFPQFQDYGTDRKTLASVNSAGVTHAEMEQRARDAYQIMMNRGEYKGGTIGGQKLIHYRSNPDCSEGDGYAMLAAAAMCDRETFNGLWLWIHENRLHGSSQIHCLVIQMELL